MGLHRCAAVVVRLAACSVAVCGEGCAAGDFVFDANGGITVNGSRPGSEAGGGQGAQGGSDGTGSDSIDGGAGVNGDGGDGQGGDGGDGQGGDGGDGQGGDGGDGQGGDGQGGDGQGGDEGESYNVYFGYLHSHTSVSDGSGSPAQAYRYAREEAGLDFFGIADHDYWPDDMTDSAWSKIKSAANEYNDDGSFVAFWGFEWTSDEAYSGYDGLELGHITITSSEDYCNSGYEPTRTLNQLVQWLSTQDAVAFLNHPGQYGTTFDKFEFDHSEKIVGMELWNRSQDYYSKSGYYSNDGGKGYYDEALIRGWYIGAGGGQDNHDADWGTANQWRMAVLAPEKTRAALLQAFKARRFYSSRDKNLVLSFVCNGAQMGSKVEASTWDCEITASDGDNEAFSRIDLLRNGEVLETWSPGESDPVVTLTVDVDPGDYLYVRLYQASDSDAWAAISSPIFAVTE